MARFNHPINNFLSGEVSPKILARSETKEYGQACEKLLNMFPQSQGGVTRRPGTQFVSSTANSENIRAEAKIFPFNISNSEAYAIMISRDLNGSGWNGIVRAFNTSTLVEYAVACDSTITALGHNLHIPSDSDLAEMQAAQYGDFLFFTQGNCPPFYIVRTALNTFTMRPLWYPTPLLSTYTQARSIPFQAINTTNVTMALSAVATGSRTLVISAGTGFAFSADMVNANGFNNATWFCFIDGSAYGFAYVTAYTSATQVTVQVVLACPAAYAAAYPSGGLSTWYESAWSAYRGFPRAITFFEGRAVFAGSAAFPHYTWGSQVFDIFKMVDAVNQLATGGTETNAMPYELIVASTENSQFQWVSGGKKISGGTGGREYQMQGADPAVSIGATNISSNAETSNGSAYVQPTRLDSAIIFVQRSFRKVMEYVFDFNEDSYRVRDLSTIADHMVLKGLARFASPATPKFTKLQYANSDELIWTLDSNGVLCSITRNRTADTLAWAEHDLGGLFGGENAVVTSMAVCNSGDGTHDDLWVIVKRKINTGVTCTFTDAGDVVTITSHGFSTGDTIGFSTITSTTGIAISTTYYVIYVGANTFTLATTMANAVAGTAIVLTTSGTGVSYKPSAFYLERINNEHILSNLTNASTSILDKPVYLDSAKLTILGAPGTVFTGFTHLIGESVSCLADGLYHGEKTVDSSGQITLTAVEATELVAGFKYTSRVVPVIAEAGSKTGSSLGRPKKMDQLAVKFHRTVGAKLLRYADSKTEDILFRPVNLAANLPIPMYTGFKDLDFPGTWEKDEKFSIETDLPLPMGILGIYVRGTSND